MKKVDKSSFTETKVGSDIKARDLYISKPISILGLTTEIHFGYQLRKERKRQNLSQVELAKRIGCTSGNLAHFEKGDNTYGKGSIQTVFKYVKALGYDEVNFKL